MRRALKSKKIKTLGKILLFCALLFLTVSYYLQEHLLETYNSRKSLILTDRYGNEIAILPNANGYWARYSENVPSELKSLLIKKEDKYFYYHPGFNPWSTAEAILGRLGIGQRRASSTITQQLVKILLGQESERNIKNKFIELLYALSLETHQTKDEIIKMYVNSVYLGNKAQGAEEASLLYFKNSPEMLTKGQALQIISAISSPNENNPAQAENVRLAALFSQKIGLKEEELVFSDAEKVKENMRGYNHSKNSYFEISSLLNNKFECPQLMIDDNLSENIREIVNINIEKLKAENAKNAAVVVIKLPGNELLALIGSPDPLSLENGYKINMAKETRPIGSTIKPFIYLEAFKKGLRPYTLVDDREYKYITALGFPLYPKNFDFTYRRTVNLHYALSNSLNVPAVKVLEYVGLQNFYDFLEKTLEFKPVQSLDNYQLGIALGALEMNLLDLSKYFTIFPNNGVLKDLKIYNGENAGEEKIIAEQKYVQLVNKILNDRRTGIEQFGMKSWLNLFQENYALKTGTSRDFRDSWIVGFTPDFLVGVWVGNADNGSMDEISGQLGAGKIWAQVMELLLNSPYNKKTPFDFGSIKEFYGADNNIEYGLQGDDYEKSLNALEILDNTLILNPHEGDDFQLEDGTQIIFRAKENVKWYINGEPVGEGTKYAYFPKSAGRIKISADNGSGLLETVFISIQN